MIAQQLKERMLTEQELNSLDKKAEEMRKAYKETHEAYYLIMLKALAKRQECIVRKSVI